MIFLEFLARFLAQLGRVGGALTRGSRGGAVRGARAVSMAVAVALTWFGAATVTAPGAEAAPSDVVVIGDREALSSSSGLLPYISSMSRRRLVITKRWFPV